MASVKHIYTGYGDPNNQIIGAPEAGVHHYEDEETGDLWLGCENSWKRVYVAESEGNVAFYSGSSNPVDPPTGPSIYTRSNGGIHRMYISILKGGEYWDWEEVMLIEELN